MEKKIILKYNKILVKIFKNSKVYNKVNNQKIKQQ